MEQRFSTKAELLKHLGKNEKDNKLVDRMILKGLVYKESWMYVLVDKDLEIERLKEEIKKLKEEWSSHSEWKKEEGNNALTSDLEKKLAESEDNLSYQMKEYERLERETKEEVWMYQECIRKCYLWAVNEKKIKITRPDFRDNVLKLKKSLPGEDNQ